MISAVQLDNYLCWLDERGQRPLTDVCPFCGYRQHNSNSYIVCEDDIGAAEHQLLAQGMDQLQGFQTTRVFLCPQQGGDLCPRQEHDIQKATAVVLLGKDAARLLVGEQRFATKQGQVFHVPRWGNIAFLLTFHPRDIRRYPPNASIWQRDFNTFSSGRSVS